MSDTMIIYSEALEEAERLTKVTGSRYQVVRIECDCDYSKTCFRCGSEGQYYDVVEVTVLKSEGARLRPPAHVAIEQEEAEWEAAQV